MRSISFHLVSVCFGASDREYVAFYGLSKKYLRSMIVVYIWVCNSPRKKKNPLFMLNIKGNIISNKNMFLFAIPKINSPGLQASRRVWSPLLFSIRRSFNSLAETLRRQIACVSDCSRAPFRPLGAQWILLDCLIQKKTIVFSLFSDDLLFGGFGCHFWWVVDTFFRSRTPPGKLSKNYCFTLNLYLFTCL